MIPTPLFVPEAVFLRRHKAFARVTHGNTGTVIFLAPGRAFSLLARAWDWVGWVREGRGYLFRVLSASGSALASGVHVIPLVAQPCRPTRTHRRLHAYARTALHRNFYLVAGFCFQGGSWRLKRGTEARRAAARFSLTAWVGSFTAQWLSRTSTARFCAARSGADRAQ